MIKTSSIFKFIIIVNITFFFLRAKASEDLSGVNLICNGQYQVIGYEFINENKVKRHASSKTDNDYYENIGTYKVSSKTINLDVEGDLFKRTISKETLQLYIGVHSNNTLVCTCTRFTGDIKQYFENINNDS